MKIVVSQNVTLLDDRGETRDGLDQRFVEILEAVGFTIFPVPNNIRNVKKMLTVIAPDGILLSGGNSLGEEAARDEVEGFLLEYATTHQLPVLGVCRGMQMINRYKGGTIREVSNHANVPHVLRSSISGSETRVINCYHNYQIDKLGEGAEILGTAEDGCVEAIAIKGHAWTGIMWHPERLTPFPSEDLMLIRRVFGVESRKD